MSDRDWQICVDGNQNGDCDIVGSPETNEWFHSASDKSLHK